MSEPSQPTPPPPPTPPVPRYGEYAPEGYVPPRPAPGYEFAAPGRPTTSGTRTRKTWDVVLTVILLVLGFFGMLLGIGAGALYTTPELLNQGLEAQGYPTFSGDIGSTQTVIVVSQILLYLAGLGGAIALLLTKRIAFWVPLVAGVIAAIVFWSALTAMLMSDPNLVSQLTR